MFEFKNLQWVQLNKNKDEYLLVAVNYYWCEKPDIDRLLYEKFGVGCCHTQVEKHMSSSDLFLYAIRVHGKIGKELSQEYMDFIEEVFESQLEKYKEYYYGGRK